MEVDTCSSSPLEGLASRNKRIIIHFDFGGHYAKRGGEVIWIPKEEIHHALLIRESVEDTTCDLLMERIRTKMGAYEGTSELKFSYFPVGVVPKAPVHICNDDDLACFLYQCGSMIGVLHVETKMAILSSADASNADIISTNCVANPCSVNLSGTANNEGIDASQLELDNMTVTDTRLVEGDKVANLEWDDGMDLVVGQEFACKAEVQRLVEKACFVNSFSFDIVKTDRVRYVIKCVEAQNGCKWSLRAAKVKDSDIFSIRTYNKTHTCSSASSTAWVKKRKASPGLVASFLKEQYLGKFDTPPPKSVIGMVHTKYGINMSYSTAWRGRREAASEIRGTPEEGYLLLYSYLYMLQEVNPGTVSYVEVDEENKFKYVFFALGACVEGFQFMRKVIVVDGTHIKNVYGGVLLVATTQDPNHHHYPIAFAVVDGEKDNSCLWFFFKLKTLIPDVPSLVFLTDRNPSLIKAIREVYPLSHHGYCVYHLSQNVKSQAACATRDIVAGKFREVAHAYTEAEFMKLYNDFKERFPSAAAYLERSCEPHKWARCYFPGERYNIDTTNCAESINSVFKGARLLFLIPMIDAIVGKISEWFSKHRQTSTEAGHLVPYVENLLHKSCVEAQHMTVTVLNNFYLLFNVVDLDGKTFYVDLRLKTCMCKRFDIDKYPCVHAIAALIEAKRKGYADFGVHDLCSTFYTMNQWSMAYCRTIRVVPHMTQWSGVPEHVRSMVVIPPDYLRNAGRPQTTRFKSHTEARQRRNKSSLYDYFMCRS